MQKYFTPEEDALLLRNARMGSILNPDELRAQLRHVEQRPVTGSYAIAAAVPNWFVEKLDPAKTLAHRYTIYPTADRLDTVLLSTIQCANVQLRCVMQLSDPLARAFLKDAIAAKLFTLLFSIEHSRQCAVMSAPMNVDDPGLLQQVLKSARRSAFGIAPAIQLTSLNCHPAFTPSLIEGHEVEDVIVVFAPAPTVEDLELAVSHAAARPGEKRDTRLH